MIIISALELKKSCKGDDGFIPPKWTPENSWNNSSEIQAV